MADPRHVLVVGGNSGVGEALVHLLKAGGCTVSLVGRRAVEGWSGWQRVVSLTDVDWDALFAEAEAVAPLDAVVFVAGSAVFGVSAEVPPAAAAALFELNFWSVSRAAVAIAERWGAGQRAGTFVAVLSLSARRGMPFEAYYCASKAAIDRFLEALRFEYPGSIRFESVYPGHIATPFHTKVGWYGMEAPVSDPGGDPPALTAQAIAAVLGGAPQLHHVVGLKSQAIRTLDRLTPALYDRVARRRWADFVQKRKYRLRKG